MKTQETPAEVGIDVQRLVSCDVCKSINDEMLTEAGTGRHVKVIVKQECCGSICNICLDARKLMNTKENETNSGTVNGRMKRLVSLIFGEPIWTEDYDGKIRKRRMRRLSNGRVVFRGICEKVVGNADGSMVHAHYVVRWYPRDSMLKQIIDMHKEKEKTTINGEGSDASACSLSEDPDWVELKLALNEAIWTKAPSKTTLEQAEHAACLAIGYLNHCFEANNQRCHGEAVDNRES
jgi:hypothetical protein